MELDADGPKRSGGIVCGLHRKLTILFGIDFLQGALHDAKALALEAVRIGDAGIRCQHCKEAGEIAVREVDRLLALVRRADRGGGDVEAAIC